MSLITFRQFLTESNDQNTITISGLGFDVTQEDIDNFVEARLLELDSIGVVNSIEYKNDTYTISFTQPIKQIEEEYKVKHLKLQMMKELKVAFTY